MIILTVEEIVSLHERIIDKTGGSHGVRDKGLLESAVYSADNSFEDVEIYPSIEEKAARLMFALTSNHAFVDGNKRIGVFTMLITLELNGVSLKFLQEELIELGLSVADGSWDYERILDWIKSHAK